ncbi:MAG: ATP synthase F1 subunit delta [Bacteroidota bacterium]
MQNPRLASRYAKSLLDLAIEQNCLEELLHDVNVLDEICNVSHEFVVMLRSPVIKADKKLVIVSAVLEGRIKVLAKAFIDLLIRKGREGNLPEIAKAVVTQYNLMKNIRTVKLTTAVQVDDSVKQSILGKLVSNMPEHSVELKTEIDEDIIGGFILEMDDKLIDASIRRDLNDVKKNFLKNLYVSELR